MRAKIKDKKGIVKDMDTGAILNINAREVEEYKIKKAAMSAARKSNQTEERLDKLENSVSEIKELLLKVLNNGSS